MSVTLGRNVFIYNGSSSTTPIIAAAKSCTISTKRDLIEKASSTQGDAKEFITGRYEWEVSMDHLVMSDTNNKEFQGIDILKTNQTVTLSIYINGKRRSGSAICTQADLSAPVGGLATGNVRFKGTGALT